MTLMAISSQSSLQKAFHELEASIEDRIRDFLFSFGIVELLSEIGCELRPNSSLVIVERSKLIQGLGSGPIIGGSSGPLTGIGMNLKHSFRPKPQ